MKEKRFNIHGPWCPTDCVIHADVGEVLECFGHALTQERLEEMAVGARHEFTEGFIIERMVDQEVPFNLSYSPSILITKDSRFSRMFFACSASIEGKRRPLYKS